MISLLLHETEAELRLSIITIISSEYTGYNWLMSHIQSKSVSYYVITSCLLNNALVIIIVRWIERGTNETRKDPTRCPENSPFTLHCGMQPMWEDGTCMTSQSDDMDTSSCTRLYDYVDDSHVNNYKQWIKRMEYLVCWERMLAHMASDTWWFVSSQGGLIRNPKSYTATSKVLIT